VNNVNQSGITGWW